MRTSVRRILPLAAVALTTALVFGAVSQGSLSLSTPTVHADNPSLFSEEQEKILSGFASFELNPADSGGPASGQSVSYTPRGSDACALNNSSNIKVNQNCLNLSDPQYAGRGQAENETSMAIDPNNTNHLVASFNDYRRGDGNCYTAYSTDKGRTWNDSTDPMSFTGNGTGEANFGAAREYWQAGGDTSVAFDTKGNVYLSCQVFNRGAGTTPSPDSSSALLLFRSTDNYGASWNFPGRYVTAFANTNGSNNARVILLDKQLMTVDNHVGSPYQDRIYVTWTEFTSDGAAFIYEAYSSDYGEHFSGRHLVSVNSPLCTVTYGASTTPVTGGASNCNENQFSDPFTGPDGALYVAYNNFNNATKDANDNHNQILLSKSTDGGNTFSPPVKVSDYYDLPDCATYQGGQDNGRACVPEKGAAMNSVFRATNYASGAVNPTNPQQVVVTFGSYINQHSNESNGCTPAGTSPTTGNNLYTGVKSGGCNNDIVESVSNDAGATFTGSATDVRAEQVVTTAPGQATTDQFWQWEAFTKGGKLAVSYYDRQYGSDETTGFSDMSLSGTGDLANFVVNRVTSSSMPYPTEFPDRQGNSLFFGDYSGLAAYDNAYPLWMDTRDSALFACPGSSGPSTCTATFGNGIPANDEDIFTAALPVPSK